MTKIVSPKNRSVVFHWDKTSPIKDLPSFQSKTIYSSGYNSFYDTECNYSARIDRLTDNSHLYLSNQAIEGVSYDEVHPSAKSYLTRIEFLLGDIYFKTSPRLDKAGAIKLDSITVKSASRLISKFDFNYSYFVSDENGNASDKVAKWVPYYSSFDSKEFTHRLKLNSIQQEGTPAYEFTYSAINLPRKTSFATDYWGFYNGKTSNVSFVPNPIHLNLPLADNGNNRRPDLQFTKASTLIEVAYPTSGKTKFNFGLHNFTQGSFEYEITQGMGLRIDSVRTTNSSGRTLRKTIYVYEGGRKMNPLEFYGRYFRKDVIPAGSASVDPNPNASTWEYTYDVRYLEGNNVYSSSLLGSGNFIGYDKVRKQEVEGNGGSLGKTVSYFTNTPDISMHDTPQNLSLPPRKNPAYPENGLLKFVEIYDGDDNLLQSTKNSYRYIMNDPYYGVKILNVGYYFFKANIIGTGCLPYPYPQHLAAYYPLYSGESVLDSTTIKEYSGATTMTKKTTYSYYPDNTLATEEFVNSNGEIMSKGYQYTLQRLPAANNLYSKNILNIPLQISNRNGLSTTKTTLKVYSDFNGFSWLSALDEDGRQKILIKKYNAIGNILEYTTLENVDHSFVWANKSSLVSALAINAKADQIAYSSFEETAEFGGWSCSGTYTAVSKTGKKGYIPSSINKGSIATGDYFVMFWARRSGSINGNINGSMSYVVDHDTWKLYSVRLNAITSISCAFSGVVIDDLKLCPVGAQMKTFVHEPLVGIITETDHNGKSVFYNYDRYGNLESILDHDNNVVKGYKYGFKNN